MNKINLVVVFIIFAFIACSQNSDSNEIKNAKDKNTARRIEVTEHVNGGGYTFIKGIEDGKELWIAVREMAVEVDEVLYFDNVIEMKDFESKTLGKTFKSILFVNDISRNPNFLSSTTDSSQDREIPKMVSSSAYSNKAAKVGSDVKVEALADGMTVEMVNTKRKELAGKKVKVRGVVTKYNANILNVNWIHIQDGTGSGKTSDLTITSNQETKVGDTIVIEGIVVVNKDFGAGYFYDVIIEEARITIE